MMHWEDSAVSSTPRDWIQDPNKSLLVPRILTSWCTTTQAENGSFILWQGKPKTNDRFENEKIIRMCTKTGTHDGCSIGTYSSEVERFRLQTFFLIVMLLLLYQYDRTERTVMLYFYLLYIWVAVREKGHDFHALTDNQYKTQSASTYVTSDLRSK
jgi:hypothetical protein